MTIGQRIKNKRIELGLSVEEVADKLGKNRATIYRYEKDDIKDLPITVLEPLAKVLKTTPADLMGWSEEYTFRDAPAEHHKSFDNIEDFKKTYDKSNLRSDRLINAIIENAEKMNNDSKKDLLDYSFYLLQKENPDSVLHAAHERTDIEVTDEMRKHDDDIMMDDSEWK